MRSSPNNRLNAIMEALLAAQDKLRETSAEVAAQVDRRARMDTHRDELARQLEGARAARERTLERSGTAKEDREMLSAREDGVRTERRLAREALTAVQDEWEEARVEESRLEIQLARAQAELERVLQRRADLVRELELGQNRLSDLGAEEETLTEEQVRDLFAFLRASQPLP